VTAAFLAWIVRKHDRRIVMKLDAALRNREYRPEIFQEVTGKDIDALWTDFVADAAK
jgi:hypothetical protein